MAHAAHNETGIADAHYRRISVNFAFAGDNGLVEAALFPGSHNLFLVSRKIQRVGERHFLVPLLKGSLISQHLDTAVCMNTEIAVALGTYVVIVLYVFHIDWLPALITFAP